MAYISPYIAEVQCPNLKEKKVLKKFSEECFSWATKIKLHSQIQVNEFTLISDKQCICQAKCSMF